MIFLSKMKNLSYAGLAQNFNCRLWRLQMGRRLSWNDRSICNNILGAGALLIKSFTFFSNKNFNYSLIREFCCPLLRHVEKVSYLFAISHAFIVSLLSMIDK